MCCFLRQFTSVGLQPRRAFTILLLCCPEQLPVFCWMRKETSFSQHRVSSTVKGARSWKSICFGGKIKMLQAVWFNGSALSAFFLPSILVLTSVGHILDCYQNKIKLKKPSSSNATRKQQQQETDALLHLWQWQWGVVVRWCMPLWCHYGCHAKKTRNT